MQRGVVGDAVGLGREPRIGAQVDVLGERVGERVPLGFARRGEEDLAVGGVVDAVPRAEPAQLRCPGSAWRARRRT